MTKKRHPLISIQRLATPVSFYEIDIFRQSSLCEIARRGGNLLRQSGLVSP